MKRTISKEIYTASIGLMYLAQKHYKQVEDARKVLAGLLAESAFTEPDGVSLSERKNECGDYLSDAIYGRDDQDAEAAVRAVLERLNITVEKE